MTIAEGARKALLHAQEEVAQRIRGQATSLDLEVRRWYHANGAVGKAHANARNLADELRTYAPEWLQSGMVAVLGG